MFATIRFDSSVSAAIRSSTRPVRSTNRSRTVSGPSRQVSGVSSSSVASSRRSFARVSGPTSTCWVLGSGVGPAIAAVGSAAISAGLGWSARPPDPSSASSAIAGSIGGASPTRSTRIDPESTTWRMTSTIRRRSYRAIRATRRISVASSRQGPADIIRTSAMSWFGSAIERRLCSRSRISGASNSDRPPTTVYGIPSSRSRATIASRCLCLRYRTAMSDHGRPASARIDVDDRRRLVLGTRAHDDVDGLAGAARRERAACRARSA